MTQPPDSKARGMCAMEIPRAARKCPFCHVFQARLSMVVRPPLFGMSLGLLLFIALTSLDGALMGRLLDRGEDFQRYADQISVHDLRIEFGQVEGEPTVVLLGRLNSGNDIGWENVKLLAAIARTRSAIV